MKKDLIELIVVAILIGTALVFSQNSEAADPWSLVEKQVQWLQGKGMVNAKAPKTIRMLPSEQITKMTGSTRVIGICYKSVISFRNWISFNTLEEQSVLLHELVHIAQNDCALPKDYLERRTLEGAAYSLQEEWLAEHGLTVEFDPDASFR